MRGPKNLFYFQLRNLEASQEGSVGANGFTASPKEVSPGVKSRVRALAFGQPWGQPWGQPQPQGQHWGQPQGQPQRQPQRQPNGNPNIQGAVQS